VADTTTLLIISALVILIFLFCREIVCWYFKINQIIDLMIEISEKLEPRPQPPTRITPPED